MLEDQEHEGRNSRWLEQRWSLTWTLIALNVAVFVVQNAVIGVGTEAGYQRFALSVDGLRHGYFWQLLTFQFLHLPLSRGGALHLLGNLFMIRLFGPTMEQTLGRAGFIQLYVLGGTIGGLLQMAGGALAPEQFGQSVVGASAGAFGLMAGVASLYPRRMMHMFFLPAQVRADWLLTFCVAVAVTGLFLPTSHVAHCAHLGGILTGFMFTRRLVAVKTAVATVPVKI